MDFSTLYTTLPKDLIESFRWPSDVVFYKNTAKYAIEQQNLVLLEELLLSTKPKEPVGTKSWTRGWNEIFWDLMVDMLKNPNPSRTQLNFLCDVYAENGLLRKNESGTLQKLFFTVSRQRSISTAWVAALGHDESLAWVKERMLTQESQIPTKQLKNIPDVLSEIPHRAYALKVKDKDASTRLAELLEHMRTTGKYKSSEDIRETLLNKHVWKSAFLHGSSVLWNELAAWQEKLSDQKETQEVFKNNQLEGFAKALTSGGRFDNYINPSQVGAWVEWIVSKEASTKEAIQTLARVQACVDTEKAQREIERKNKARYFFDDSSTQPRQVWWDHAVERVRLKKFVAEKTGSPVKVRYSDVL